LVCVKKTGGDKIAGFTHHQARLVADGLSQIAFAGTPVGPVMIMFSAFLTKSQAQAAVPIIGFVQPALGVVIDVRWPQPAGGRPLV
jgi:hypothetical protein